MCSCGNLWGPVSLTPIAEHLEVELALPVLMTWVCNGQDSNTQSSLWRQTLLQTVWPLHSLIDYNFEVHLEKILIGIYVSHVLVINKSRYIFSSKISQYWGVGVKRNCKSTLLFFYILIFFFKWCNCKRYKNIIILKRTGFNHYYVQILSNVGWTNGCL